jgi:hypothetical protein
LTGGFPILKGIHRPFQMVRAPAEIIAAERFELYM